MPTLKPISPTRREFVRCTAVARHNNSSLELEPSVRRQPRGKRYRIISYSIFFTSSRETGVGKDGDCCAPLSCNSDEENKALTLAPSPPDAICACPNLDSAR